MTGILAIPAIGILSIAFAGYLAFGILKMPSCSKKMQEIAAAIGESYMRVGNHLSGRVGAVYCRVGRKGMAMTWKRLFVGMVCLAVALSYLLVMAIRGNIALQRQIFAKQSTNIK